MYGLLLFTHLSYVYSYVWSTAFRPFHIAEPPCALRARDRSSIPKRKWKTTVLPSASWAIDSEPIRAGGIIVKYYVYSEQIHSR